MPKPAIFSDLEWVTYAETHRIDHEPLSGNLTDRPAVLDEENHQLVNPDLPFDMWQHAEQKAVRNRDKRLRRTMGLVSISYPNPVHGVQAISLDSINTAFRTSLLTPPTLRPNVDAIATSMVGYGVSISPADCIVMSIADEANHTVGQIHAGYVGLEKRTIEAAFSQLPELNAATSRVYLSAHARNFPLHGEVLDRFQADESLRPHVDKEGNLNMASIAIEQLVAVGVQPGAIQVDPRDTFTDPALFSFRRRQQKGANGRNGLIIGIKRS